MKTLGNIFGAILIVIGVAGFISLFAGNEQVLGLFEAAVFNHVFYIATGLGAVWAGTLSAHAARNFFRIFGAVYLGLAFIGFLMGEGYILGVVAQSRADNWLHLVLGLVAAFFGFAPRKVVAQGTSAP